jgi:hypothetical protein
MQTWYSVDFNVFTVIFLLLIFWCLEIKLKRIQKKIDEVCSKLNRK